MRETMTAAELHTGAADGEGDGGRESYIPG